VFHHRLFAVWASVQASSASEPTAPVQVLMVSGLTEPGETEKAASTLEALASELVDLPQADLARLQAAKR
jgi:chemotaxis response regulator CheB